MIETKVNISIFRSSILLGDCFSCSAQDRCLMQAILLQLTGTFSWLPDSSTNYFLPLWWTAACCFQMKHKNVLLGRTGMQAWPQKVLPSVFLSNVALHQWNSAAATSFFQHAVFQPDSSSKSKQVAHLEYWCAEAFEGGGGEIFHIVANPRTIICSPYTEVWILKVNCILLCGNYEKRSTLEGH